jgi:hypothetical protein
VAIIFWLPYKLLLQTFVGIATTSINPIFRKILLKASPNGKTEADSDKYP